MALAVNHPNDYPAQYQLLTLIAREIDADRLIIPLTLANIYETQKINKPVQRHDLAVLQATVSRGLVFRGRHHRLEVELGDLLREIHGHTPVSKPALWFISDVFFESAFALGDERLGFVISDEIIAAIRSDPGRSLYDYLIETPEDARKTAVQNFSLGLDDLRQRLEERRRQHAGESLAMRRRVMSALLMMDEIDLILMIANKSGFPWKTVSDMGDRIARRIIEDVPTYFVEREIALRLEAQSRPIEENDFRDMQSFSAVVPYADAVIAEKQFVNLALQASLHKRFSVQLSTDLNELENILQG